MTETTEPAAARSTRAISVSRLLLGWLVIVALFFIWQTAVYAGLVARFAEWQFAHLGGYFPLGSLFLFVVLLGLPVLYVLSQRAQRERKAATPLDQGRLFIWFLTTLAGISAIAAIVLLGYAFTLSLGSGTPVRLEARSGDLVVHDNGPVTLSGTVLYDRIAVMGADTPLAGWGSRFAPVMGKGEKGSKLRYFVQTSNAPGAPKAEEITGALRRNGLRGDIVSLFTDAGYEVADPHYVVYTEVFALRLPYFWGAAQCALVALILSLAAGLQKWRLRRLGRTRRSGTPHAIG
ncbi:hypothetical protein AB2M62_06185 [Sphingomonas sp. MMS12-HWE2-04]|uniref:hypothetical protein n=1 Tax=Sphingomonas sp. MMS12-HWE2-04 TaxID=3234199 RepID=UPI00384B4B63